MAIKDYLTVNIEKPVGTYVDLTNYFQARVGDIRPYCKLHIMSGSRSVDMSDKKIMFCGRDPNGTPFIDAGGMDDDQGGDDRQAGLITFHWPEGIFQTEGTWQLAYFTIQTDAGEAISTVNLTLNVLPNNVAMGISIRPFLPEIEDVRNQVNDALRDLNAQQLLNQIDSMKTTVNAYTDLITSNQILNKPQATELINDNFNNFSTQMNGKMTSLQSNVNSQLSNFNQTLNDREWTSVGWDATLLNGATGWVSSQLAYNNAICIGRIIGWVIFPAGNFNIDFATNPLNGIVNFHNSTIGETVVADPQDHWYNPRILGRVNLDQNDTTLGMWPQYSPQYSGDGSKAQNDTRYGIFINMMFMGSRSMVTR